MMEVPGHSLTGQRGEAFLHTLGVEVTCPAARVALSVWTVAGLKMRPIGLGSGICKDSVDVFCG